MCPPREETVRSWCERLGIAAFLVVLTAHIACCLQGWNNLPVDGHEFRQTQTAISIRYLIEDGVKLDYDTPILGKPWAVPLEFPLYQGAVAVLARTTGLPLVQSGRAVGILAFYLALPAVYLLLGRLRVPRSRRLLLLTLLLSSPLYLYYTRTIMIESTALCLGTWFLWGFWALVADGRRIPGILALGCGALGMMVKLPALAGWLMAAAFILAQSIWDNRHATDADRRKWLQRWAGALAVLGGSVAAGLAWSAHTDALKALNPVADLLRSGAVARWGMGPFSLRFTPAFWHEIARITATSVLSPVALLALGLLFLRGGMRRIPIAALLACALGTTVVFANLYQVHDYYSYSTGIFLLGATALVLERGFSGPRGMQAASWGLCIAIVALNFRSYARTYYPMIPGNAHYANPLGDAIRAITAPSDVIIIYGQDWNPVTPYFAERRTLMFPATTADDKTKEEKALGNLAGERVAALIVTGPRRLNQDFVRLMTMRFGLSPDAVLEGRGSSVYVRAIGRNAAAATLRGLSLGAEHTIPEASGSADSILEARLISVADLPAADRVLFRGMNPVPQTIRSQYGFGPTYDGDRPVFGAHPITELVFVPPAGARRLHASYGILPKAYEDSLNNSDGVGFTILARLPDGTATRLVSQWLQPKARPEDRGIHSFDILLPEIPNVQIILLTTPGPAGNYSYDWAFWDSVSIQ